MTPPFLRSSLCFLLCATAVVVVGGGSSDGPPLRRTHRRRHATPTAAAAAHGEETSAARASFQESPGERCANNYTMVCVKRDLLAFLNALDGERSYEIYPGFSVNQRRSSPPPPPPPSHRATEPSNSTQLDSLIAKRLNDYAESIEFRVKLINPINRTARSVGTSILERILPFFRMSRKKKDHQGLYWAVGTMAAVGASALMALSSKALMTAGAALAMAVYSCMKSHGGGKSGGSHLTATLMEESALVPHRQCAETAAVVDISGPGGHGGYDVQERFPGTRKTIEIVSPAMPVYRVHQQQQQQQQQSDDYGSSSYGTSQSQLYQ